MLSLAATYNICMYVHVCIYEHVTSRKASYEWIHCRMLIQRFYCFYFKLFFYSFCKTKYNFVLLSSLLLSLMLSSKQIMEGKVWQVVFSCSSAVFTRQLHSRRQSVNWSHEHKYTYVNTYTSGEDAPPRPPLPSAMLLFMHLMLFYSLLFVSLADWHNCSRLHCMKQPIQTWFRAVNLEPWGSLNIHTCILRWFVWMYCK